MQCKEILKLYPMEKVTKNVRDVEMYRNSTTVSSQLIFCNLSEEDRQMSRLNVTILMACTPFRKNVTNLDYQSAPLHSDIVKSILSYSIPSSAPHLNFLSNRQEQYKPH